MEAGEGPRSYLEAVDHSYNVIAQQLLVAAGIYVVTMALFIGMAVVS